MTTAQLTPRVKVMIDYPGSPFKVGEVLTRDYAQKITHLATLQMEGVVIYHNGDINRSITQGEVDRFPHIFKRVNVIK